MVSKRGKSCFHIVIVLMLMIGIGNLPAVEPITPFGMQVLGIFVGMLYGWTFCSMIWVSLLGMLMMCLTGAYTTQEFFALSFGNETVVFILFVFIFTALLEKYGLSTYLANWFISRKIVEGRPWLFSFILLLGAFFVGGFVNMIAAMLVFWSVIYAVSEKFGLKPYDKYPTLMILGVAVACLVGGAVPPYKLVPMIILTSYTNITGDTISMFDFMCYALPIALLIVITYILVCRFIFRPDIKELKNLRADLVDPAELVLNRDKKIVLSFFAAFLFLLLAPGFLPQNWVFTKLLNQIGMGGTLIALIILLCWIPSMKKKSILDFGEVASKGINWDIVIIMAVILPFTSILTSDSTGIKDFLSDSLAPILSNMSPLVFMIVVLLLATLLTNFANNVVIGAIFVSIVLSVTDGMGLDPAPIILSLIICCSLAFLTPAGSPATAFVFANHKWVKASDIYKYAAIFMFIAFLITIVPGLLWANIIF